ncbi:hypothetical protein PMAYCL1PPCAC_19837, partial [Pristionchus mayeri]
FTFNDTAEYTEGDSHVSEVSLNIFVERNSASTSWLLLVPMQMLYIIVVFNMAFPSIEFSHLLTGSIAFEALNVALQQLLPHTSGLPGLGIDSTILQFMALLVAILLFVIRKWEDHTNTEEDDKDKKKKKAKKAKKEGCWIVIDFILENIHFVLRCIVVCISLIIPLISGLLIWLRKEGYVS